MPRCPSGVGRPLSTFVGALVTNLDRVHTIRGHATACFLEGLLGYYLQEIPEVSLKQSYKDISGSIDKGS